jgi:glycerate-2-kinase
VLLDALEAALAAADPYGAVAKYVKRSGDGVEVAGRRYELSGAVHVVGFSKAPLKMAQAVVDVLGMPWLALSFRRWAAAAWAPSRNCIATTQSPAETRYTSLRGSSSTSSRRTGESLVS